MNGLIQRFNHQHRWAQVAIYLAAVLMAAESILYTHYTYSKIEDQARVDELRQQIPATLPNNPVLFVARHPLEPALAKDIDAMLLAQDLGWPTLNGYSGNYPPGYAPASGCFQLPREIKYYMEWNGITDQSYYLNLMKRIVPIGFDDCDPTWWDKMP
jgi:hypothetical protein